MNLSPKRLIDLWHQLETCWDGENSFGSNTAEIYVYTLCDTRPSMFWTEFRTSPPGSLVYEAEKEAGLEAAQNLYHVIKLFIEKRECNVAVDGKPHGEWLLKEVLYHRCHVEVVKK
jgi:hypothetical protein